MVGFGVHTSPESSRADEEDFRLFWEILEELICHFFALRMLKSLHIDMSRWIEKDIFPRGECITKLIKCFGDILA